MERVEGGRGRSEERGGGTAHLCGGTVVPPDVGGLQWPVVAWDDGDGARQGLTTPWEARRRPGNARGCLGIVRETSRRLEARGVVYCCRTTVSCVVGRRWVQRLGKAVAVAHSGEGAMLGHLLVLEGARGCSEEARPHVDSSRWFAGRCWVVARGVAAAEVLGRAGKTGGELAGSGMQV